MSDSIQITAEQIETYQRDGVVLVKGLFRDWVQVIMPESIET